MKFANISENKVLTTKSEITVILGLFGFFNAPTTLLIHHRFLFFDVPTTFEFPKLQLILDVFLMLQLLSDSLTHHLLLESFRFFKTPTTDGFFLKSNLLDSLMLTELLDFLVLQLLLYSLMLKVLFFFQSLMHRLFLNSLMLQLLLGSSWIWSLYSSNHFWVLFGFFNPPANVGFFNA